MKAERNKTIDLTLEQGEAYLSHCLTVEAPTTPAQLIDQVILGDLFQVAPHLPRSFVDLLIVDPPYNINKEFHGNKFCRRDETDYEAFTQSWLEAVVPLLKPTATVYVCCDWISSPAVARVLGQRFPLRNRITWQREKGRGAKSNWKNAMEDIWYATVGSDYFFDVEAVMVRRQVLAPYRTDGQPKDWEDTPGGKFRNTHPSNFWDDITVPYWSMAENTPHPTQKPEKLLAKLILASSRPGDVVLDPFGGAGSTAVTAQKLGRHFVTVEQNPLYCVWAQKRLELAQADPTIQGYQNGVFWERNSQKAQKKAKSGHISKIAEE